MPFKKVDVKQEIEDRKRADEEFEKVMEEIERPKTHFIEISQEQFEKMRLNDRIIITNNENNFCYTVYLRKE